MERKIRFIDKLKMASMFVFNKKEKSYIIVCDYCGSSNLEQLSGRKLIKGIEYKYNYRCNNCGATCLELQYWKGRWESDENNQSE